MSAELANFEGQNSFGAYGPLLDSYTPLYKRLMLGNPTFDGDDLKQEIALKFLKHFTALTKWEEVENKKAYIVKSARNVAMKMWERTEVNHDSLDDEESLKIHNSLSDEGHACSQMNQNIDLAKASVEIGRIVESGFSMYEQKLIELNFYENCKPSAVAEILMRKHRGILEQMYPEAIKNEKRSFELLKRYIAWDCNRVKARFLPKIKNVLRKYEIS